MHHLSARLSVLSLLALSACTTTLLPSPSGFDNGTGAADEPGDPSLPEPSQKPDKGKEPPAPASTHGALDTTYGAKGKVAFASPVVGVDALVLADDALVLVARSPDAKMMVLAKYDTTGTPDKTFGLGGAMPIAPSGTKWLGTSSVATGGGKLFVLGFSTEERGAEVRAYLANGKADKTFGTDGAATLKFPEGFSFEDGVLAYSADGRLFFGGSSSITIGYSDLVLGSVAADGTDATSHEVFPGTAADARGIVGAATRGMVGGIVTIGEDAWLAGGYEVKLAGTGKYETRPTLRVTRADGSTSAIAFSGTGFLRTAWDAGKGRVAAVGVVGSSLVLAQATADGAVDDALAPNGLTKLSPPCDGELADATPGPDGGFYVLAKCSSEAAIARFDASGKLVTEFGKAGIAKVSVTGAARLRRQKDGALLVIGTTSMARVLP